MRGRANRPFNWDSKTDAGNSMRDNFNACGAVSVAGWNWVARFVAQFFDAVWPAWRQMAQRQEIAAGTCGAQVIHI